MHPACSPETIDMTNPSVTTGSLPDMRTILLSGCCTRNYPICKSGVQSREGGTYYIKGTDLTNRMFFKYSNTVPPNHMVKPPH